MTAARYEQDRRDAHTGESRAERDAYHDTIIDNVVSIRTGKVALNPYLDPNTPRMNEKNPYYPEWFDHAESQPYQGY